MFSLLLQRRVVEHTFVFVLPDRRSCKHLWKCAIEHHTFFRVSEPVKPPTRIQQFFRLKSRFYTSFRTEHQLNQESNFGSSSFRRRNTPSGQSLRSEWSVRDVSGGGSGLSPSDSGNSFRRMSSRRFNPRPSFSASRAAPSHTRPPSMSQRVLADVSNTNNPTVDAGEKGSVRPTSSRASQQIKTVIEDHRSRSPLRFPKD